MNRTMTREQLRRRKFFEQRLIGMALLVFSAVFVAVFKSDATAAIITAPLGAYLLLSRKIHIL